MRAIFILLVVLVAAGGGAAYYTTNYLSAEPSATFRTATVKKDTLLVTIGATGTAEPEDLINVGAQVAGRIESFGRDPYDAAKRVDYCTAVEEGTVLANIDPTMYKAQHDQAVAAVARAKADLVQLQAKCNQTEQEWKRARSLKPTQAIADTDYDLARANYLTAQANVEVGKAAIKQSEAELEIAKANLDYTVIKSPVRGVIIARRVNVGQTVVAALNAPSLFLLAKDLRRMQIWASVNEADIGRIHPGQPVRFTLATYPGETFEGKVVQIRLNAQSTQNVVTYTVVVSTDNPPTPEYPYGKLLPYMTTDVRFEVERQPDVLLVPNAALRWRPQPLQIVPEYQRKADRGQAAAASVPNATGPATSTTKSANEEHRRVWVKEGDLVRPVRVRVGKTDGSVTEVSGEGLKEGLEVVVGAGRSDVVNQDGGDTKNPFIPQIRGKSAPKAQK
ncbi:MAG: efflux RND transporter periplasmic adaptor subunit [Planctomycetaceae bacterium]|nr:efflux RND transporter periplasmic adaptor subunit [Planctomycetaceae bacterium]